MSDPEEELKRLEAAGEAFLQHVNRERKPKGKGGLSRRTRLKPVSDKRKTENEKYSESIKWLYGRECELCGIRSSLSRHHSKGRGKYLNDKSTWKCLCLVNDRISKLQSLYPDANFSYPGGCHGFVEANRSIAESLGLTDPEK